LNFSEKINVVVVGSAAYLDKVFGNSALFSFHAFSAGNVDIGMLSQADLVILNGVEADASLVAALRSYQDNAGTVLIIPASKSEPRMYQPFTPNLTLTRSTQTDLTEMDKPDYQNPFFENVFEERSAAIAMPRARTIVEWGADRSALLAFKDGRPFLSKVKNTYLLASPLDPAFTDFQTHGIFVPVMYRIAASSHRISQKPYYMLSESMITLQADSLEGEVPVRLIGKQEVVPSQRRNGDRVIMELPKFSIDPGFYYATVKQDTVGLLAFDVDKQESLLNQFTGEEAKALLGGGKNISLFDSAATDSFSNEIKERYLGTPLWKVALLLALAFLLAEVLLIRFLK